MKSSNVVRVLLAGAAAAALGCGTAFALPVQSLSYSYAVPSESTNWTSSIGLQKFSHSLGTLQSVAVDLSASVTGSLQIANTQTFVNVTSAAISATASGAGFTTSAHTTHCTAASINCSIWNITFSSALPATIPTSTIHSNLSAQIALHLGAATLGVNPTVAETDVLDAGPAYDPSSYSFVKQYSGAVISKTTALAKTISSSGIVAPNVVPAPSGPSVAAPCDSVFGTCTVGAHSYQTGVSHSGLLATGTTSAFYTLPVDLAAFYGNGLWMLPIDAAGLSSHDGGGNVTFKSKAFADATVNVIYTYIPAPEPMTIALFGAGLALTGLRRRRKV